VGGLAIALALGWSATAHLLWQVESRQEREEVTSVRWVLSALEPSTPHDRTSTEKKTPRSVSQPVLPDGEAPAPCQIRRSLASDVEVLTSLQAPLSAAEPAAAMGPDAWPHTLIGRPDDDPGVRLLHAVPHASLPRPPPPMS
jgi:hypothetical protein